MSHREDDSVRVSIISPVSSFGEVSVSPLVPYAQLKFTNGILSQKMLTTVSGSGAVTTASALVSVSTGATVGSIARLESTGLVRYAPGQGVEIRFTTIFTAGVVGTTQIIGIGNAENALAIGMHGTTLAVLRRTGGQVEIQTLTVTGAPSVSSDLTITLNGGAGVTVAVLSTDTIGETARKIADADYSGEGGGWRAVYAGNRVVFLAAKTDTRGGAYTYGAGTTGSTGSFAQTAAAVAASDNWIDLVDWNTDSATGDNVLPVLDVTQGQVCRILYQWLGFGMVTFAVENPETGEFRTVHRIRYANANTTPIVMQPDMPLMIETDNGATTSVMVAQSSSLGAFALGELALTGPGFVSSASVSTDDTEAPVLAIRLKNINLEGVTNTVRAFLDEVSFGSDGVKIATFTGYLNPTLTGAPTWSDVDASESTVEVSTDMTSSSGGATVFQQTIGNQSGGEHLFRSDLRDVILRAGDIFLVTAQISSGAAANLRASITWVEDV